MHLTVASLFLISNGVDEGANGPGVPDGEGIPFLHELLWLPEPTDALRGAQEDH